MEDEKYWIWFSRLDGLKCINKKRLIQKYRNPKVIYNLKTNELKCIDYLSNEEINEILRNDYRCNLDKYHVYIVKNKIKIINFWSEEYPKSLREIYDSPVVLYAKGDVKLLKAKSIAIIGSRKCTEYGRKVSNELGYNIANDGICVVSGMAKGIDSWAHIGALNGKGKTIAVVGNGLDIIYPKENERLFNMIIENGGLIISEFVIGTEPNRKNFPQRNRIISGLAECVIVVEATERSGSLITVDFAIEQGKDVFAVPGNITNSTSKGTNNLIAEGAKILTDFKNIFSNI